MDSSLLDPVMPVDPPPDDGRWSRGRTVLVVVGLLVVVLTVLGVWLGVRALQAATALQAVADGVRGIEADVRAGRAEGLQGAAAEVEREAARAARATSDPVWWLAEQLPVVGADAAAVRTVAGGLDALARGALTPLAEVAQGLDVSALRPVDGRVDLAPLVSASPALQRAAEVTARVEGEIGALDAGVLHGPLVGAVTELQDGLASATEALGTASRVAQVLPGMLGADGPRSYLVLFLNSAELRAQGGIVGAFGVITADDGRVTLSHHGSHRDLPDFDEPVLPLTAPEVTIAGEGLGRYLQNTVMLPDTPRAGALAAEMWRRAGGQSVDGVVLVDPVALSYVLEATGDVVHPDGSVLSADTLVRTLLLDAYVGQDDDSDSDEYFADAASATFAALASGQGDPAGLVDALRRAADERRLSLWSAHPAEHEEIRGTDLDGGFLSGGHDAAVGVFLDNSSGWKTDTFLRSDLAVEEVACDGGAVTMQVVLTLASTVPPDAAALPYYVVGDGSTGVPVGTIRQRVSLYTPVGGSVQAIQQGEAFLGASGTSVEGREVRILTESLGPGETTTLRFTVRAPARGDRIPVWSTPTTTSPGRTAVPIACPSP